MSAYSHRYTHVGGTTSKYSHTDTHPHVGFIQTSSGRRVCETFHARVLFLLGGASTEETFPPFEPYDKRDTVYISPRSSSPPPKKILLRSSYLYTYHTRILEKPTLENTSRKTPEYIYIHTQTNVPSFYIYGIYTNYIYVHIYIQRALLRGILEG